jgi:tetratricopeptide (TPR) repeat protein
MLNPNNSSAFNERGYAYSAKGDYDRAIADYDEAIRLDSKNVLPINNRGNAFELMGDYPRAALEFDEITRLQPGNAEVWNRRCWARAIAGIDLQQALWDCNESLRLRANDATTLENRGLTYFKLGQLDDAIANYDAVLKINPEKTTSLYGRGMAKLKKGDAVGGDADIAAAKALEPGIVEQSAKLGIQPNDTP